MATITYQYATADANGAWRTWVTGSATSASTANTITLNGTALEVWQTWIVTSNNHTVAISSPQYQYKSPPLPTPEQLAERKAKQEAELEAKRQAEARADALLAEFLDAMQRDQLVKDKAFVVLSETGKRYEIKPGKRVAELGADGKPVALYCIHPEDYQLPDGDVMLAQKLMLETDEKSFLKIANRTPVGAM